MQTQEQKIIEEEKQLIKRIKKTAYPIFTQTIGFTKLGCWINKKDCKVAMSGIYISIKDYALDKERTKFLWWIDFPKLVEADRQLMKVGFKIVAIRNMANINFVLRQTTKQFTLDKSLE